MRKFLLVRVVAGVLLIPAAQSVAPAFLWAAPDSTSKSNTDPFDRGPRAHIGPPIMGTVVDSAGVPLPNALVAISRYDRNTTTNREGQFVFRQLAPGRYELRATLIGYAPIRLPVVVPDSGEPVRVKLVLTPTVIDIDAMHVTATPVITNALDMSQSTAQLSGQALARQTASSVAQTLQGQPGLASRYNGPVANTPVIRGLTGDRVLVLQNGERTADLSAAAADHALTIDPLSAQRIEVVRGPASLLYGSNAIGGVVNVIATTIPTAVPTHLEGYFATQGESVNPGGGGSMSLTAPLGRAFATSLRGSYRGMSDTRQGGGSKLLNSAAHQGGGAWGLGFIGDHAKAGLSYEGTKFNYGLPGEVGDPELGAQIRGNRQQVIGRSDFVLRTAGLTFLQVNGSAQWYKHDEVESTGDVATSFNLKTQTFNATSRTQWGRLTGAIGLQGLFKQYAAVGEEALTPAANSNAAGLFVYQDLPLMSGDSARVPRLQLGARYDIYNINSKAGDPKFGAASSLRFNNTSGSLGLVVPVASGVSVNGNISRAFRAPTVEELFSNAIHAAAGTYDVGNAGLKAETNNGAEVVVRAQHARLDAQLSGYYNRVNNYVTGDILGDTVVDGETVPLNQYAQADATLKGIEGNIEGVIARNIVLGAMGDMVRGTLKSGDPLPYMPSARLGTQARYDNGTFSIGADYRHGFKQTRVPVAVATSDPSAVMTGSYNLVNLSAGYRLIDRGFVHAITVRVDNIFDEQYKDATSRIKGFAFNPGRNVSLVYKVLF